MCDGKKIALHKPDICNYTSQQKKRYKDFF